MLRYLGPLLIATGVGHALVGIALFPEPLAAIVRDGFVNAVHPRLHLDRGLAFWFMILTPVCVGLGICLSHGVARGDEGLLRIIGWTILIIGVLGAAAIPVSGFWIFIVLSFPALAQSLPQDATRPLTG